MLKIKTEAKLYLTAQTQICPDDIVKFESNYNLDYNKNEGFYSDDATSDGEALIEGAGRVCYMSFKPEENKKRRNNFEYIKNIIKLGHGSVLEHATATILFTGVSRTFTHELVRHRAGFAYSQLSQRYVDLKDTCFVKPPILRVDTIGYDIFLKSCEDSLKSYSELIDSLSAVYNKVKTRKQILEAARCVLPNCTETIITVTANLRAWRHFLEMRCTIHADLEMNLAAFQVYKLLCDNFPVVFSDYNISRVNEYYELTTEYKKI